VKKSRQNGMETFSGMKAGFVIHPLKSVVNSSQGVRLAFHTSCYLESYGQYSTDSMGIRRQYVPIPILPSHSASPRTLTCNFTFASFNICRLLVTCSLVLS